MLGDVRPQLRELFVGHRWKQGGQRVLPVLLHRAAPRGCPAPHSVCSGGRLGGEEPTDAGCGGWFPRARPLLVAPLCKRLSPSKTQFVPQRKWSRWRHGVTRMTAPQTCCFRSSGAPSSWCSPPAVATADQVFSGHGTAIVRADAALNYSLRLGGNALEIERNDPTKTRNASTTVGQWALSDEVAAALRQGGRVDHCQQGDLTWPSSRCARISRRHGSHCAS